MRMQPRMRKESWWKQLATWKGDEDTKVEESGKVGQVPVTGAHQEKD